MTALFYFRFSHLFSERLLASPDYWSEAALMLHTIGQGAWMNSSCIDAYLLKFWLDNEDGARAVYLPTQYLNLLKQGGDLNEEEVQHLRSFVGLDRDSDSWQKSYLMLIDDGNHHFVAVFDFVDGRVNAYGRYNTFSNHYFGWRDCVFNEGEEDAWYQGADLWMGTVIYQNLHLVLTGRLPDVLATCETVNWLQVRSTYLFLAMTDFVDLEWC